MKRSVLPLLLLLNVGLLGVLAWRWFTPQGELRAVAWQAPTLVRPALDARAMPLDRAVELGRYVATLDRPLFVPSRRPAPPPPPPAAVQAVAEAPPDLRVLGLYGARGDAGPAPAGMIARVSGRVQRVRVGETIGRWTLKELRANEAVLALGETVQTYPLRRASPDDAAVAAPPDASGASPPAGSPRASSANVQLQREMDAARQRLRAVNALRARNGMPPIPEP